LEQFRVQKGRPKVVSDRDRKVDVNSKPQHNPQSIHSAAVTEYISAAGITTCRGVSLSVHVLPGFKTKRYRELNFGDEVIRAYAENVANE